VARANTTNLHPSTDRFVGRERELAELRALFDGGHRLVTVVGSAGTGKTRLADTMGARAHEQLGLNGVWRCELAETRDLDGLCSAVGHALGVPAQPSASAEDHVTRLGRATAARGPVLLILDNLEHLAELAARTISVWLTEAPDLRLLVTSREPLRVRGEVRLELSPLSLPSHDGASPAPRSDAADLFVDRVQALVPSFAVDNSNRTLVDTVVRRLEGIPLAIELAASRVELLGLQGLLDNLDQRLDLLVDGARDRTGRHSTLRAAIDSSWDLLDEDERECLAMCAVFRGGFSPAAAAEIVGPSSAVALRLLQSLRNKSLLRRLDGDARAGHTRFGLFESIRVFAEEQLDALGLRALAEQRHARYFMDAGAALAHRVGAGQQAGDALDTLASERGNLLAVHRWAMGRRDADAGEGALRCAIVLDAVSSIRGPFASHRDLLERTVDAADTDALPAEVWIQALEARARARTHAGLDAAAKRDLDAALTTAARLGDERWQGRITVDLAMRQHRLRDMNTARALYDRALEHARKASDRHLEGRVLGNIAALLHDRRKLDEALAQYRDALALLQEEGDSRREAIHVANLGILEQERGEFSRARGHYEAALELLAALGDQRLEAIVMGNLGSLHHERGDLGSARACHERALAILRSVADRHSEALCLGRLARVHAAADYIDDAGACIAAAERLLGRHEDPLATETVRIDHGFIDLARARAAGRHNDAEAVRRHAAAATSRIEHASVGHDGEPSWADRSDDIRAATRLLRAELAVVAATPGSPRPSPSKPGEPRATIVVGPDARWFEVPEGPRQDLSRRRAIRLILARLVDHQREAPGGGLPLEALKEAGWPGERMVASAGANRVYVALTTLRKLGLRKYLLSQDDGYLLDPAMPTVRPAAEPTSVPT